MMHGHDGCRGSIMMHGHDVEIRLHNKAVDTMGATETNPKNCVCSERRSMPVF